MSGSLPDEWFRARDAQADQPGAADGVPAEDAETAAPGEPPTDAPTEVRALDQHQAADGESGGDTVRPAGTFGSNAAGTTFSLGEVRETPVAVHGVNRASRVRRVIQASLLLSLALAIGLLIGSWWSENVRAAGQPVDTPTATATAQRATGASASPSASVPVPYVGHLQPLAVTEVTSTCTQPPLHTSGGSASYSPANLVDGNADTAWRCYGNASGQRLTFTVPHGSTVVGFGIINGFASTSGSTDLYEKYRRVLRVRWTLPDGRFTVQTLADHQEGEQIITIPPVGVDGKVTLNILDVSAPGRGPWAESNATLMSTVDIFTSAP